MPPPLPKDPYAARIEDETKKELAKLLEVTIEKAKPRLRELGGAYGKYNRALQENTEKIIFAVSELNKTNNVMSDNIAGGAQKILEATMTYMDRSAMRTRKILSQSIKDRTDFEKEMFTIDRQMEEAKDAGNKEELKRLSGIREDITKRMTIEDKSRIAMREAQEDFLKARTDFEREAAQERGNAVIRADKILLQETIRLRIEAEKKGNEKAVKLLLEREESFRRAIKSNSILQEETLDKYKAGIRGFAGEVMSKSFTGGLVGALFKGQGFADLIPNMAMAAIERSGVMKMMGGGMASVLFGSESEEGRKATQGAAQTANIVAQGSQDMSKLADAGLHAGSIFTHDIHLEKLLEDILKALGGQRSTPTSGGGGGKTPDIKAKKGGIGGFLASIAAGVKSFGTKDVFKGAAGMFTVGLSLAPFVAALTLLAGLPVSGLLAATAAIAVVATTVVLIGKFQSQMLQGALALGLMGIALLPVALSFMMLGSIDTGALFGAIAAIAVISTIVGILGLLTAGPQAVVMAAGAATLAVLGLALIPFAGALLLLGMADAAKIAALGPALLGLVPSIALLAMMGPFLPIAGLGLLALGGGLMVMGVAMSLFNPQSVGLLDQLLNTIAKTAPFFLLAAVGIAALSASLLIFGIATAAATGIIAATQVASAWASFLGLGSVSVLDQIFGLAQVSDKLMQTATALNMIASAIQSIATAFTQLGSSEAALETLDQIISLDATQIQTLQDVSMAMDKIMSANQQLRGENQAGQIGAAAGAGAGGAIAISSNSQASSNNIIASAPGRSTDPSILFSGERYYSMIYR